MKTSINNTQNVFTANSFMPLSQLNQSYINKASCDEFCFSEMYVDLDRDKSVSKDRAFLKGKINGFDTTIRKAYSKTCLFLEGEIGNRNIAIQSGETKGNKRTVKCLGEINGKQVNITVESDVANVFKKSIFGNKKLCDIPKIVEIKGEFDNKPFDLKIPNADVPSDTDTKNLVAVALNLYGLSPQIYKNKIVGVNWKDDVWDSYDKYTEEQNQNKKENIDPIIQSTASNAIIIVTTSLITTLLGKCIKSK